MLITDYGVNMIAMLTYKKEKTYFELSLAHPDDCEVAVTADLECNTYYARVYHEYGTDVLMPKLRDILVED